MCALKELVVLFITSSIIGSLSGKDGTVLEASRNSKRPNFHPSINFLPQLFVATPVFMSRIIAEPKVASTALLRCLYQMN